MKPPAPTFQMPCVHARKRQLARWLDRAGILRASLRAQMRWNGPYLRCLNYHSVPAVWADGFERQLRWFSEHFVSVGWKELWDLHEGHWPHARPGLLLSFDDGCRSHAEVVAPLLERCGFVGWFFVPAAFPDVEAEGQRYFAHEHSISACSDGDPRVGLTWSQVRYLDQHHVVGSHTLDHVRLAAELGEEELRRQIVAGKQRLEGQLGHAVEAFSWVGGEEWSYSAPAARYIAEAGFRAVFGTNNRVFRPGEDLLRIERTNVEADYEPALLRFQLSGLMDLAYARKRRRLARTLAPPSP